MGSWNSALEAAAEKAKAKCENKRQYDLAQAVRDTILALKRVPEKYGNRNVAKMIREVETFRQLVRSEGTPAVQEAWDKIEEHIDYAYRRDIA